MGVNGRWGCCPLFNQFQPNVVLSLIKWNHLHRVGVRLRCEERERERERGGRTDEGSEWEWDKERERGKKEREKRQGRMMDVQNRSGRKDIKNKGKKGSIREGWNRSVSADIFTITFSFFLSFSLFLAFHRPTGVAPRGHSPLHPDPFIFLTSSHALRA